MVGGIERVARDHVDRVLGQHAVQFFARLQRKLRLLLVGDVNKHAIVVEYVAATVSPREAV